VRLRRAFALVASTVMVATILALPSIACATPGDFSEPVALPSLPWSAPYQATLVEGGYFCTISLTRGQTVDATLTVDSGVGQSLFAVFPMRSGKAGVFSDGSDSGSVHTLNAMASASGSYGMLVLGENAGDFSLELATTTPVPFRLSTFGVPKSKKRKAKITIFVRTNPRYNGFASPVRFQIERRKSGKWRPFTSAGSSRTEDGEDYSKFLAKVRLSKRGTYRIRAKFSDAAHEASTFTVWKTIKIK
jgi:hypothetical protein